MTDGIRWADCDGHQLAYKVVEVDASSAVTVLFQTGIFIPIEVMWDDPVHARFLDGLAGLGRLVVFDRRGVGMSDPVSDWTEPILPQWARDAAAVVEAVDRGPVHAVGWEWGGMQAQLLAATRPDLVASVTAMSCPAVPERLEAVFGLSLVEAGEVMAQWILGRADVGLQGDVPSADVYAPSRHGDPAAQLWIDQAGRRAVSPTTGARMWRSMCTPGLPLDHAAIRAPVMALRRRDDPLIARWMCDEVVDLVPDGRVVEVPGVDIAPYGGDVDAVVAAVARFVTGDDRTTSGGDRQLMAVLFSDIVGSTESAGRLGDDRWRGVLDAHDQLTSQVVRRHGGRVVKNTGDGLLAVFPLVSRAVRAAVELRADLAAIDVVVRQGVHVGEVIDRAGDVAGLAVHVAARVMAHAGAGEILTTAAVPLLLDRGTATLTARGEVELRGVDGPWALYAVDG